MSTLSATTLKDRASGDENPVLDAVHGSARAWVNFNGTGTVAIRASYNVTSITDNGTGDYTVNFTTAMQDANYSPVSVSQSNGSTYDGTVIKDAVALTTGSVRFLNCRVDTGAGRDPLIFSAAIFR